MRGSEVHGLLVEGYSDEYLRTVERLDQWEPVRRSSR